MIPDLILDRVMVTDDCWIWTGATKVGYAWGQVGIKPRLLHRHFYEELRGPIPEGLHIDHLCRVRHCVNPWHMEPVTQAENTRRGESPGIRSKRDNICMKGLHSMDDAYVNPKTGARHCRPCHNATKRKWVAKRRLRDQEGQR